MTSRIHALIALLSCSACAAPAPARVERPTAAAVAEAPAPTRTMPAPGSPFVPLAFLIGRWEGDEDAVFGRGRGEREYRLVLGGTYLLSDNEADYPAQEKLPKGQHHVDWTLFSFDRAAKRFVVRQFNGEGFVNHLVLDPASQVPDRLVFVSVHSENAPPGMRARLELERVSADELTETFELAEPDGEFQPYVRTRWRRVS